MLKISVSVELEACLHMSSNPLKVWNDGYHHVEVVVCNFFIKESNFKAIVSLDLVEH